MGLKSEKCKLKSKISQSAFHLCLLSLNDFNLSLISSTGLHFSLILLSVNRFSLSYIQLYYFIVWHSGLIVLSPRQYISVWFPSQFMSLSTSLNYCLISICLIPLTDIHLTLILLSDCLFSPELHIGLISLFYLHFSLISISQLSDLSSYLSSKSTVWFHHLIST